MNNKLQKSLDLSFSLFDIDYGLRVQVFSFGWHGSKLIAIGRNKNKTHPLNRRNKLIFKDTGKVHLEKKICAELDLALKIKRKTNIDYKKITIVNVRLDRNGNICNSKPCRSCESLIEYIGPRSIYYTNTEGKFEKL